MEAFPCLLEHTVASALLLLSGQTHLSPPKSDPGSDESQKSLWLSNFTPRSLFFMESTRDRDFSEKSLRLINSKSCPSILPDNGSEKSVGLSNSKSSSCLSSLTIDDGSSAETRAHQLRMVVDSARCHEKKLKVVRKCRTQIMRKSHQQKKNLKDKVSSEVSTSTVAASSCLSSGSSGGTEVVSKPKVKSPASTISIRSRAEGIMRVLSYGCASEVRIRQLLGDSPGFVETRSVAEHPTIGSHV